MSLGYWVRSRLVRKPVSKNKTSARCLRNNDQGNSLASIFTYMYTYSHIHLYRHMSLYIDAYAGTPNTHTHAQKVYLSWAERREWTMHRVTAVAIDRRCPEDSHLKGFQFSALGRKGAGQLNWMAWLAWGRETNHQSAIEEQVSGFRNLRWVLFIVEKILTSLWRLGMGTLSPWT